MQTRKNKKDEAEQQRHNLRPRSAPTEDQTAAATMKPAAAGKKTAAAKTAAAKTTAAKTTAVAKSSAPATKPSRAQKSAAPATKPSRTQKSAAPAAKPSTTSNPPNRTKKNTTPAAKSSTLPKKPPFGPASKQLSHGEGESEPQLRRSRRRNRLPVSDDEAEDLGLAEGDDKGVENTDDVEAAASEGAEEVRNYLAYLTLANSLKRMAPPARLSQPAGPAYAGRSGRALQGVQRFECVELTPLSDARRENYQLNAHDVLHPAPPIDPASGQRPTTSPVKQPPKRKRGGNGSPGSAAQSDKGSPTPQRSAKRPKQDPKGKAKAAVQASSASSGSVTPPQAREAYAQHVADYVQGSRPKAPDANSHAYMAAWSESAAVAQLSPRRNMRRPSPAIKSAPRRDETPTSGRPAAFSPATPEASPCPPSRGAARGAAVPMLDLRRVGSAARANKASASRDVGRLLTLSSRGSGSQTPGAGPSVEARQPHAASSHAPMRQSNGANTSTLQPSSVAALTLHTNVGSLPEPSTMPRPTRSKPSTQTDSRPALAESSKPTKHTTGAIPDHIRQQAEHLGMKYLREEYALARKAGKDPDDFMKRVGENGWL
ncbi:hypothetical protein GGG16DRAFT_119260 [Schizophyllum commune]